MTSEVIGDHVIQDLDQRLKKIKLLIMDVDGVLTDGSINIDDDGKELKKFDVQDGFAIVIFQKRGFKTAIISARECKAVTVRAADLKIDKVHQGAYPKTSAYESVVQDFNLNPENVCFIGDDLPDLCLFKRAGLAITVANGREEVKRVAHYVTKANGGRGAVREVIEMILKAQGHWQEIVDAHSR
jgi:3-deoxy-D-manno-octulosonate 8-phosphate phosphatase (KDO 8-P phosphatase)